MSEQIYAKLAQAVIDGEPEDAAQWAQRALDQGIDPLTCINQGLTPGITRVGELFATGEYFLPDLVLGGDAMRAAVAILEPALSSNKGRQHLGCIVLGTVKGDLHEIGKTLVATMLTANGFRVVDIGVDQDAGSFLTAIRETGATLVGASALLTTTMPRQRELIEALQEAGLRERVRVMVGGAPVTEKWASEIGADGYAEDAVGAIALAKRLVGAS